MNSTPNTMGRDGFFWFQAVVEDRKDPKKLGRLRVRILGLHTDDKNLIPSDELPWAHVITPITSAAMNGLGEAPVGPVPGTWVIGFFRDGESAQEPVIFGTMGGIPEEPTQKPKGFYDPRDDSKLVEKLATAPRKIDQRIYHTDGSGVTLIPETQAQNYPRVTHPLGATLNEPDTNRLARNERIPDTIIQKRLDTRDLNVPVAFDGSWDEPATPYKTEYPYNHVKESESGHLKEVDDTPNFERTHDWNRSGSFEEIVMDGTKIIKVVGHNFEVLMRDNEVHVMGKKQQTIQHNYDLYVQGNWNIQVDKNVNLLVKGDVYAHVEKNLHATVDKDIHIAAGGDETHLVGKDTTFTTSGKFSVSAKEVDIKASGDVNIDGANVWIESGKSNPEIAPSPKLPKIEA